MTIKGKQETNRKHILRFCIYYASNKNRFRIINRKYNKLYFIYKFTTVKKALSSLLQNLNIKTIVKFVLKNCMYRKFKILKVITLSLFF